MNFTSPLKEHVKELLIGKTELKGEVIQVKLSGDGAQTMFSKSAVGRRIRQQLSDLRQLLFLW